MNKKHFFTLGLLLCLFISLINILPLQASSHTTSDVLILYSAEDTHLLAPIKMLVESYGQTVTLVSDEDYTVNLEQHYDYSILISPSAFYKGFKLSSTPTFCIGAGYDAFINGLVTTPVSNTQLTIDIENWTGTTHFLKEATVITDYIGTAYGSSSLTFDRNYPFSVIVNPELYYVPYINTEDISLLGLGSLLKDFFHFTGQTKLYVTIKDLSVLTDPNRLTRLADAFYAKGIPFMAYVDPVYTHYDYPAFIRFCEALRYIESRNGTLLLNTFFDHQEIALHPNVINEDLNTKLMASRTAFKEAGLHIFDLDMNLYPLSFDVLSQITSQSKRFGDLPFNASLTLTLPNSEEDLTFIVDTLNAKWLSLYDMTPDQVNEPYLPSIIDEPDTPTTQETSAAFEGFFNQGNKLLIIIIGISITVFIFIIILGRYLYKQKFYSKK